MTGDEGLWVRSEVMPDGTYGVALNVGEDRSWALSRDRAVAYAVACFVAATEVEHSTAVMRLLTGTLGVPADTAGQVITQDLQPDRLDGYEATRPLRYIGVIGRAKHPRPDAGTYVPLLNIELDGRAAGQLTPADLRDHAAGVLNVIAAADLDAGLLRALTGTDEPLARAAATTKGQCGVSTPDLEDRFRYHPPQTEQRRQAHESVRGSLLGIADHFNALLPDGREKSLAITKLEEAMFWANASLARRPDEGDHA